jgi:hypothetical protein
MAKNYRMNVHLLCFFFLRKILNVRKLTLFSFILYILVIYACVIIVIIILKIYIATQSWTARRLLRKSGGWIRVAFLWLLVPIMKQFRSLVSWIASGILYSFFSLSLSSLLALRTITYKPLYVDIIQFNY